MRFNTKLIHAPVGKDNNTGAVTVPIYKATTYRYPQIDAEIPYAYSRSGNPTRHSLEAQMASLENGKHSFAFSSGMAAIHAALSIFKAGDHLIIGKQIYGGTFRILHQFFERWGITITAVDTRNINDIKQAIRPNTRAIYFEPVTNPLLQVTSVSQVANLAHHYHLLTIVDNTFLSPYLLQPLSLGADIVIHSATKYLSGHSDILAGIVTVKDDNLAKKIYFVQKAIGSVLSPEDSYELLQGIKTLGLRLDCQVANVKQIIKYLQPLSSVDHIYYPGISGFDGYDVLHQQATEAGGTFSFELADNVNPVTFVNNLHIFQLAVSLGSVESLVELPSKMSHADLSPAEQLKAGIKPGLIRLSVGIEDIHDLINDIHQALLIASR